MSARGCREVYGLCVTGIGSDRAAPRPDWPRLEIRHADRPPLPAGVGADRAVLDLPDGRQLILQRRAGRATFTGPALTADELDHPYLGAAASVFNRWSGREVFHAGAFVSNGSAWVVVGGREAGKSTLLAALAARGVPILADDLVVTDGREVFAGPRCIDLREPVPGAAEPLRKARRDSRWRVSLPPLPRAVRLGGWIYLRWGDEVTTTAVPASVLIGRTAAWRSWGALPSDPEVLLALAACPAWDLVRPADWARMDESLDLLLDRVAAAAPVREG